MHLRLSYWFSALHIFRVFITTFVIRPGSKAISYSETRLSANATQYVCSGKLSTTLFNISCSFIACLDWTSKTQCKRGKQCSTVNRPLIEKIAFSLFNSCTSRNLETSAAIYVYFSIVDRIIPQISLSHVQR